MSRSKRTKQSHRESHAELGTTGWLRPLVLGAEDGIVPTPALVIGVAAAGATSSTIISTGFAGLVAGALSMAVGEYVSVAAQRDSEQADIGRERWELEHLPEEELAELTSILVRRGMTPEVARIAAEQMTAHDALATHLREELALHEVIVARPWLAAFSSAASFSIGALFPVVAVSVSPHDLRIATAAISTLVVLAVAGAIGARLGRSRVLTGAARLVAGGAVAMIVTWAVGRVFGAVV
ncbi:MAG: VIT1/CCC1 transporter family protein [Thermoleophilia bacterium]|nr:VIT1/CCC1 transporter family protein [Thermoleophilia bacterium]